MPPHTAAATERRGRTEEKREGGGGVESSGEHLPRSCDHFKENNVAAAKGSHFVQAAQAKREKEAMKKVLRRERKQFRGLCKTHNHYSCVAEGEREGEVVARRMQELEELCISLSVEQLQALNERLGRASAEEGCSAVDEAVRNWLHVYVGCGVCVCSTLSFTPQLLAKKQKEEEELAAQARCESTYEDSVPPSPYLLFSLSFPFLPFSLRIPPSLPPSLPPSF